MEVATRDAHSSRATPGVVFVLTREDILASGARDLLEVLQLVPGFTFHSDVAGVVGVGFRGPGSTVYGGNAELAVINVTTRTAEKLRGAELAARYAQVPGGLGDWSAGLSAGWRRPEHELDVAVHAQVGQGRRSTDTFTDYSGATSLQRDDSPLDPLPVGLHVKWKRLKARVSASGRSSARRRRCASAASWATCRPTCSSAPSH